MSLTPENEGYFNERLLQNAKPGVVFINIARGELSPSADMLKLLGQGILAGIGLDVYNHESELAAALREGRDSADPEVAAPLALAERGNVILTPHSAWSTVEARQRLVNETGENIRAFVEGHPRNLVT